MFRAKITVGPKAGQTILLPSDMMGDFITLGFIEVVPNETPVTVKGEGRWAVECPGATEDSQWAVTVHCPVCKARDAFFGDVTKRTFQHCGLKEKVPERIIKEYQIHARR
jgi:hypothetical protein